MAGPKHRDQCPEHERLLIGRYIEHQGKRLFYLVCPAIGCKFIERVPRGAVRSWTRDGWKYRQQKKAG